MPTQMKQSDLEAKARQENAEEGSTELPSTPEVKERLDEIGKTITEFRKKHEDNAEKQSKATEAKLSEMAETIMGLNDEVDAMKAAASRPGSAESEKETNEALENYKDRLDMYFRKGRDIENAKGLIQEVYPKMEHKELSVGVDPDGGYFVTPQMANFIIERNFETSPVRELANNVTIGTDQLEIIVDDDEAATGLLDRDWETK